MLEHNNEHTFNLKEKERKRIERQKERGKRKGMYNCLHHQSTCCPKSDTKHLFCTKTNIRFHPIREQLPW